MSKQIVIPMVVFFTSFILALVFTILSSYVWDKETPISSDTSSGVKAMPPFPTVVPLVMAPPTDPLNTVCVNLVGSDNGSYVPSPLDPLRQCSTNADCAECHVTPTELDAQIRNTLACVPSDAYPDVADQQASLGNNGSKFCLPYPRTCLAPQSLVACTHDADCAACDDDVGDGVGMQCQIVSTPKVISRVRGDPKTADDVVTVDPGKWCLPRTGECNAENGVLQWTTDGWSCNCKYPNVHGGDACNLMKACNNFIATPWSRDKQQLLVNENTSSPRAWSIASGINPELCHNIEEEDVSKWDLVCNTTNPNLVRNTVCQCDGLMMGSYTGFRNEIEDPLTCTVDSCSVNAMGGRATEPLALVQWSADSNVPPNQCVCSGANSRIWDSDARNPDLLQETDPILADQLRTQEGYVFRGRCNDITLPNSQIVITAHPDRMASDICADQSNQNAAVSSLVPGYAKDAAGNATVSVCSTDPCTGSYSDPNFAPPDSVTSWGHYDATVGACSCVSPSRDIATACDNTLNPVCSTCVNACAGMDSDNPNDWPCRQHPTKPCMENPDWKPECITDSNGNAQCVCPSGCGNIDGFTCAKKFEPGAGCLGFVGVPNICEAETPGGYAACKCHRGKNPVGVGGGLNIDFTCEDTDTFYAKCTSTTSETPTCRKGGDGMFISCGGSRCPEGHEGCGRVDLI